ncbi:restriction endonuclease subunit S [uncultured Paraglaciecola sp.]|uniref:restriction endonuclease subunit S n=1 Tax=uncultured Paraglaciecola sp. TaxID=1765024 RepID=UPI002591A9C8|nr:restriction endonuclease subunit S [uncultured Paraglaciecola sp.]
MKSNVIPKEWVRAELQRFCNILSGNAFKSKDFVSDGIPVVKISNIQYGEYVVKNQEYLPSHYLNDYSNYIVSDDDLLIALTRPITNEKLKICRYPKNRNQGLLNQRVAKLTADKCLPESFILYQFRTEEFMKQVKAGLSETLQPNLSPKSLASFHCVLPPLAEQKVIADKLDTLLAQVETTKARLDRIPQILKTFRQSVLAAAVSGKLTEEWRTRQEKKTAVLDYRQLCLKQRKIMSGKKKTKVAVVAYNPDIVLPENWRWQSLDEISIKITDGTHHSPKSFSEGEYKYVTSKNVREGYIDLSNISYVSEETHREIYNRCDVKLGDVLYVKDGANTGLSCVNDIQEEISLLSSVGVLKLCSFMNPFYVQHYLNSPTGRKLMLDLMGGTAIKRLTLTKIGISPISVPTLEEQTEIVRRVEELFAFADSIEEKTNAALERVNKLTQSILAKAFRGELTADWRAANPDLISGDNSAEALLAKIKAEREAKSPMKKVSKKPRMKKQ